MRTIDDARVDEPGDELLDVERVALRAVDDERHELGGHVDHLACRDAALSTGLPVTLYADLPYAIRAGWPAWVTGRPPRPHLVPEERWEEYLPAIDLTPRAVRLPPEEVALRERALRAYATQFDALNGGPLGLLVHPEIQGFEVHWDVMT